MLAVKYYAVGAFMLWSVSGFSLAGDPFQSGKDFGGSTKSSTAGVVTDAQARAVFPGYTDNAPESGFLSRAGAPFQQGADKKARCAAQTQFSNDSDRQDCDAVKYLSQMDGSNPFVLDKQNDPLFVAFRNAMLNKTAFNSLSSTQCTTKTVELSPAQHSIEVCNEYLTAEDKLCSMGREVVVDADTNYQCGVTSNAYETLKCRKWINASVTSNCTSQWVSNTLSPPTGPTGHALSTYDDLRHGTGAVCSILWPGSSPVSATCYPAPITTCDADYNCSTVSAHGGCDHLHNGEWFYSGICNDQGWCNGDGIASITCQKLETVCNPVVTITVVNECSTLEARAQ